MDRFLKKYSLKNMRFTDSRTMTKPIDCIHTDGLRRIYCINLGIGQIVILNLELQAVHVLNMELIQAGNLRTSLRDHQSIHRVLSPD